FGTETGAGIALLFEICAVGMSLIGLIGWKLSHRLQAELRTHDDPARSRQV
ncbi:hypothetical protein KR51_00008820, partial [Rubidibacter lacunae KORDI 51-2]